MKPSIAILSLLGAAAVLTRAHGEGQGDQVVVVYNTRVPESKGVAEHYAALRRVPPAQVLGFDLPETEDIQRDDFSNKLQKPLLKALEKQKLFVYGPRSVSPSVGRGQPLETKVAASKIRYAVLCYGVPLRIAEDPGLKEEGAEKLRPEFRHNEAAVDSELACLPIPTDKMILAGPLANPFFGCTNAHLLNPTNGILLVTRLDGPTAEIARGLVDKAIQAETDGLWGRTYFDLRGLTNGGMKIGDDWIRGAMEVWRNLGYETVADYNERTFPANFPLSQVAFYAGWYDEHVSGPFAQPTVEFMPGAIAYHLHSFSAVTLRSKDQRWAGPLLARGATATMGCVAEPYLEATPDIAIFAARLTYSGFSFGEAAYAGQRFLSWQITVVGDPLYRPFAKPPQQLYDGLAQRHSKLIEWYYLRLVNLELLKGVPTNEVTASLAKLCATNPGPVLMEKLADLYSAQDKVSDAINAWAKVLDLDPSRQQRVRVMLALASRQIALGHEQDAYQTYQQFVAQCPDYPDEPVIYRRLLELAEKLGKKDDAEKYQQEISRPAPPAGQAQKEPLPGHGI